MQALAQHRMAGVGLAEIFLQVLPGGKGVACARHHDDAAGLVHFEAVERLVHFEHDGGIDGVALLRTVEGHPGDPILHAHDDGLGFAHLNLPAALNIREP